MIGNKGDEIIAVVTNGQSWLDLANQFTGDPVYELNIAAYNNMLDQSITGKRYRIEIPVSWLKTNIANQAGGGTVTLPVASGSASIIPGVPNWALAVGVAAVLAIMIK